MVTLRVPPLRGRKEDIRKMTDRFIAKASSENNKTVTAVRPDFYRALESYDWPGNVRQLRNMVESAVLLSADGILSSLSVVLPGSTRALSGELSVPEGMTLEQIECAILESKLRSNNGNRTLTADQLGLSRRTIQRKIKEHKLPY